MPRLDILVLIDLPHGFPHPRHHKINGVRLMTIFQAPGAEGRRACFPAVA